MAGMVPALKVESPIAAVRPVSVVAPVIQSAAVLEARPTRSMPSLANFPLLQVISDEEDDEDDEEKEASEGSGEGRETN